MKVEDIGVFLPKFLSPGSQQELFEGLKDFPDNIDSRIYSDYLKDSELILQGDGIKDMLIVNLPSTVVKPAPSIILSNTCDIDPDNKQEFPAQIMYAPILSLNKYEATLKAKSNRGDAYIAEHIRIIKKQQKTQIFYLPGIAGRLDDSIVFLDRVCNFPNKDVDRTNIKEQRLFTLSNYGEYLFLLKLSIHFTRMNDKIDRNIEYQK